MLILPDSYALFFRLFRVVDAAGDVLMAGLSYRGALDFVRRAAVD